MALPFPLELAGQLVGLELIAIALALGFRHKYVDGFRYPWQVPFLFFALGSAVVIIVSRIAVVGIFRDVTTTFVGYALIGMVGLLGAHYFWLVYPFTHPDPDQLH